MSSGWCQGARCRGGRDIPPCRRVVGGRSPHQCRNHECGRPWAADFAPALAPGLYPTGTRPPAGASSGSPHPEAAPCGAGNHFGGGQSPDVTTKGGGSVPPPAREPAGGSSSRAPPGSRSAQGAPAREQTAGNHGIGPLALGPGGRSPRCAWEGGAMPDSAREPAGGSSSRAPPGSRGARDGQGLGWRDAVAEVVRSEVTRSLVTMLRGSTPRPAERRGRARRSSRRR